MMGMGMGIYVMEIITVIGPKTRDKRDIVPFLMEFVSSDSQWC